MTALSRRALLAGSAALVLQRRAFAQPRSYGLQPFEVADGIWMIEGRREVFSRENGGDIVNIALLATDQGAIIVDSGSTVAMGTEIRAFAEQRLGGLAATINTHHHPDHWFGNAALADRPLLALAETAATCREYAQDYAETLYSILGSWISGTRTTPATGNIDPGTSQIGGRALRMIPLAGHTSADLAILDEATGVLIAGDLVFLDRAPSLPDADFATWLASLDQLEGLGSAGVVPGHGSYHRTGEGITQTRAYLQVTRERLRMAAELGLTPAETMAAGPAPEFAGLGANPEEYLRSVVRRFGDLETGALPVIGSA